MTYLIQNSRRRKTTAELNVSKRMEQNQRPPAVKLKNWKCIGRIHESQKWMINCWWTMKMVHLKGWGSTKPCVVTKHDDLWPLTFCNEIRHFIWTLIELDFKKKNDMEYVKDDKSIMLKTRMMMLIMIGMMKMLIGKILLFSFKIKTLKNKPSSIHQLHTSSDKTNDWDDKTNDPDKRLTLITFQFGN